MTFNELLKFLISAVNPKIMLLKIQQQGESFLLKGDVASGDFRALAKDARQLMYYLIDLAPLELTIEGDIEDKSLKERLVNIFDAKHNRQLAAFNQYI